MQSPSSILIRFLALALLVQTAPGFCNDPADGPTVTRVYAVGHNTLAVEIVEGKLIRGGQVPYVADPTDELVPDGSDKLVWKDGTAQMVPSGIKLYRNIDGKRTEIGFYIEHANMLTLHTVRKGAALGLTGILSAANYKLSSNEDDNFGSSGIAPVSVSRKSKPIDEGRYGKGGQVIRHRLYLESPHAFVAGKSYEIDVSFLNTQEESVSYTHGAPDNWTETIHVNQVGYDPDDVFKRALLSLWKGTGGAQDYDDWIGQSFDLVNVFTGKTVYSGTIEKLMDDEEKETQFSNEVNNAQTSVYGLDFSQFNEPGLYRVAVDGLGCSFHFPIMDSAWLRAFRVSMMGFLHHRSGIELGAPFTSYERPNCFHPDIGTKLLQTDVMTVAGESDAIKESLSRLWETAAEVPEAWGGYMDAGDWDRRSMHLSASYKHLELVELFPDYYANVRLSLPPAEANNAIPDLLDEVLWNVEFYQRLQTQDGGVRGGVESTAHPRNGEASWQESLLVGVFSSDAVSSYRFAACAAKAGRLLEPYDSVKAAGLKADAIRAWEWAEENIQATLNAAPPNRLNRVTNDLETNRALAAVELFRNTGDTAFQTAFAEQTASEANESLRGEKYRDAYFAYASLPQGIGKSELKQAAEQAVIAQAELALSFQAANPYGIASDNKNLPMIGYLGYYSTPGMVYQSLPRAHALTGDERYLAATVAACNFPNGANPDNLCYTSGIGEYYPTSPLHVDQAVTAQEVPAGITVYGPSDPAAELSYTEWVHVWRLANSMEPNSRTWPAAEWYVNLPDWPAMTEYTIHQSLGPTSYYWGYLAGVAGYTEPVAPITGSIEVLPDGQGGVSVSYLQADTGLHVFRKSADLVNWQADDRAFDKAGDRHEAEAVSDVDVPQFFQVLKAQQ